MALIKSNQLIQTGTAVVAGDQIVADAVPGVRAPESAEPQAQEHVVPASPLEEIPSVVPLDAAEPAPPPGYEEPEVEESEPLGPMAFLEEFAAERDTVIDQAMAEAEFAAQEATGHLGAPDATLELEEASAALAAVYPEGSPAHAQSMEIVTPAIEQQAATALETVSIQSANDARWRTLATAEEQVAALVDNFARRVMLDPPTELAIHSLMAERESILAEARMHALRLRQDAEEEAARIVQEGQARATHTLMEVETQRQRVLEELKQQGYAEGYQEGRAQADEEGAKILQEVTDSLNHLAGLVRTAAKKNEEKLLKLALGIAEKVLHDEIPSRPETVLKILDEALAKVSDLEEVVIKVAPEDMPVITEREESIRDRLRNVRKVTFEESSKVQRGGVFIETASGSVDAQIKTQLSVFQEAFDAVRAEYAQEPLNMTGSD